MQSFKKAYKVTIYCPQNAPKSSFIEKIVVRMLGNLMKTWNSEIKSVKMVVEELGEEVD